MALKDIKRRIKSVESTMQITKAMQLVASSKLRRAKDKMEAARPYFETLYDTMREITAENSTFESIYTGAKKSKRAILVVIAGDRGLAGGFNSNVFKHAAARFKELTGLGYEVVIVPIGKKSVEFFVKRGYTTPAKYMGIAENLNIYEALDISAKIVEAFAKGNVGKIELVFTEFVSPLVQTPKTVALLPPPNLGEADVKRAQTTYEPSPEEVFDAIIPDYAAGALYCAIAESYAAELAARRMAMENATDNAQEMIENLSLVYNRVRQGAITQELTEIVGGAQAISN